MSWTVAVMDLPLFWLVMVTDEPHLDWSYMALFMATM